MKKILLILILIFIPICSLAETYDQYDSGTELSFPSGTHEFIVNGISSYRHTEWYLNNTHNTAYDSYSGYWAVDPSFPMSATPGGHYEIKALLYDDNWNLQTVYVWDFYTIPYPPTTLISTNVGATSATVYGYGMSGATGYTVAYRKSGTSSYSYLANQTSSTTLSGLSTGTSYDVKVKACNQAGCSNEYIKTNAFTTQSPCSYSVSNLSDLNMTYSGDSGSTRITGTPTGCVGSWTSSESLIWVDFSGAESGSGSGTWYLNYTATPNSSSSYRSGSTSVAGQTLYLGQAGAPSCSYSISPTSVSNLSSSGASGTIQVSGTPSGCVGSWSSSESLTWVNRFGNLSGSGSGPWSLGYEAIANTSTNPRSGSISVAGKTFSISQLGAPNTRPTQPSSVTAENVTSTSVRVRWNPSTDVNNDSISYYVRIQPDDYIDYWTNLGSTSNTYIDITGLQQGTNYHVEIKAYDGTDYSDPPTEVENLFKTTPPPNIVSAYWFENSQQNTTFNEGEIATAAVKLEGILPGAVVAFDLYERDDPIGCDGDYLATIEGMVGSPDLSGYSYATANWETNTYYGLFEDALLAFYPEQNEVCFVAKVSGLEENSSQDIEVDPKKHELDFIARYIPGINRLSIGVYDKDGFNLAANLPLVVTVDGNTYNLETGDDGSVWEGLFDLVWSDGYYGSPGYAYINNLNLVLPEQITITFPGDNKYSAVQKTLPLEIGQRLQLGTSLRLSMDGEVYVISDLTFSSNLDLTGWVVKNESGQCVTDDAILAKLAIHIENIQNFGGKYNSDLYLSNYLLDKKSVDIVNDGKKGLAYAGTITGVLTGGFGASSPKLTEIIADKSSGLLLKGLAFTLSTNANSLLDLPITVNSYTDEFSSSHRALLLSANLYIVGDVTGGLKNIIYDDLESKIDAGQVVEVDEIAQLMRLDRAAYSWMEKSSYISSHVRDIAGEDFNNWSMWWQWAQNVIPFGSTVTSFFTENDFALFNSQLTTVVGENANDVVWEAVDLEYEEQFTLNAITQKIIDLQQAGLIGSCVIPQHTVTTLPVTGGSVAPTSQLIDEGAAATFNLSPQTGYSASLSINGTCPIGYWNNNTTYTTGNIVGDCSIGFSFTQNPLPVYTVNATVQTGGSVTPTSQPVDSGASAVLFVTTQAGYTRSDVVGGTCVSGSWNGNSYSTGPVNSNCSVEFYFSQIVVPPVVAPISNQAVLEGGVYIGPTPQLTAQTAPPTWSLLSGPAGMTINANTGVVSWSTPVYNVTPYFITIVATNSVGTGQMSWQLTVNPDPQLDSDGDGVIDSLDQCPGTSQGISVDSLGCPVAETLNFAITTSTIAYGADYNQACSDEFGPDWGLADWVDLEQLYADGNLPAIVADVGYGDKGSTWVTRNGDQNYTSNRDYFASYHNHNLPSGYLAHDNIDNYYFSLGSWYGSYYALCKRTNVDVDTDGDGVPDSEDQCTNTPVGVDVNGVGCPFDYAGKYLLDSSAEDSSGRGLDGIEKNGVTYVSGLSEQAASFDGVNDYIDLPESVIKPTEGSVSLWFKANNLHDGHIFSSANTNSPTGTRRYIYMTSTGFVYGTFVNTSLGESSIFPDQWYHAVLTWGPDQSAFYVDGSLVGTGPGGAPTPENVNLGSYGEGYNSPFNGLIDEVRIYDRVLSPSEVTGLYQQMEQAYSATVHQDLNADGTSDVLLRNSTNGQWRMFTMGNMIPTSQSGIVLWANQDWVYQDMADYDADGDSDVLMRNSTDGNWRLFTVQDGTIISNTAPNLWRNQDYTYQASADFDADGDADILLRDTTTGFYRLFTVQDGAITGSVTLSTLWRSATWDYAGTGDFDNDGDADILLRNSDTGDWRLFTVQDGNITGSHGFNLYKALTWTLQGIADYDKDGDADVLMRDINGYWQIFEVQDGQVTSSNVLYLWQNTTWVNQSAQHDLDGDGDADILLRNSSTGLWRTFTIENLSVTGNGSPLIWANQGWQMQ